VFPQQVIPAVHSSFAGQWQADLKYLANSRVEPLTTKMGYPVQLPLTNRLGPAFRPAVPARAQWPLEVLASRPDTAGHMCGTRTGRATATLAQRASIRTRDPRFAHGVFSSIYIPYSMGLPSARWFSGQAWQAADKGVGQTAPSRSRLSKPCRGSVSPASTCARF